MKPHVELHPVEHYNLVVILPVVVHVSQGEKGGRVVHDGHSPRRVVLQGSLVVGSI